MPNAEDFVPLVAVCLVFGMPIVAMLLHHQRKMAETLRGGQKGADQMAQLQAQVQHLSHLVHQNTIAIDDVRQRLSIPQSVSSQEPGLLMQNE